MTLEEDLAYAAGRLCSLEDLRREIDVRLAPQAFAVVDRMYSEARRDRDRALWAVQFQPRRAS